MRLPLDFTDKVCVVTGASRGVGLTLARDYAAGGAKVVAAARSLNNLETLAGEVSAAGGEVLPVRCDISDVEDCGRLVAAALDAFGQIDILVNNAAVTGFHKPIQDLQPAEWEEVLATNLTSSYATTHFAAASMIRRGRGGAIVQVSAAGTSYPSPTRSDYVASKGGVEQLTRVLAHELGPYGIRVNTVTPGFVEGERATEAMAMQAEERGVTLAQVRTEYSSAAALKTGVQQYDVSNMIAYLTSDYGRGITAQNVHVDAGLTFT